MPIQAAAFALDYGGLSFKGEDWIAPRAMSWRLPESAHPWASAPIFALPGRSALASLLSCS